MFWLTSHELGAETKTQNPDRFCQSANTNKALFKQYGCALKNVDQKERLATEHWMADADNMVKYLFCSKLQFLLNVNIVSADTEKKWLQYY